MVVGIYRNLVVIYQTHIGICHIWIPTVSQSDYTICYNYDPRFVKRGLQFQDRAYIFHVQNFENHTLSPLTMATFDQDGQLEVPGICLIEIMNCSDMTIVLVLLLATKTVVEFMESTAC